MQWCLLYFLICSCRPKTKKNRVSGVTLSNMQPQKRQSAIFPIRFQLISLSLLLAMFYNYEPHLEEYLAVYRISELLLDIYENSNIVILRSRFLSSVFLFFFFNKTLVHDFINFQLSDWNKTSCVSSRQYFPGDFSRSAFYYFSSIFFVFESFWTYPFVRSKCVCMPGYTGPSERLII